MEGAKPIFFAGKYNLVSKNYDIFPLTLGIQYNFIKDNMEGVIFKNDSIGTVFYNSIINNSRYNLDNNNTNLSITIYALSNWWGSNVSDLVNETIYGNVSYDPWLSYDLYGDNDSDGIYYLIDNN